MPGTPLTKTARHAAGAKSMRHGPVAKGLPTPIAKVVQHLEAGEWQSAHALVQKDATPLGCWAHGIVHLIEGDLDNAKYWYRRAHRVTRGMGDLRRNGDAGSLHALSGRGRDRRSRTHGPRDR